METILLSTAYLPPISWMAVALKSDNIAIEIHETYPKQTFRNRCNIATSSGILSLTVPVIRTNGNHTKTCDIGIDNSKNWQQLHWRSIVTAYNRSPYFLYYRDFLEPMYHKKHDNLIDLNQALLAILFKILQVKNMEIFNTDQYTETPEFTDRRNSFHPKKTNYQEIISELPRYIQTFEDYHGYIADLSIIDLLFSIGPQTLPYLEKVKFSNPF